jgi:hypothetical protein
MDAKWPFMLITFGLLFILGLTIAGLERSNVMKNWDKRRCELPVMAASTFFKPDSDARTRTEFAKDNFSFCMKSSVDKFMQLLMHPINTIFGKHMDIASSALDSMNSIRNITQTMYNTLLGFLDQYYRKFNASVYEMSRITQYMRMAMRRANAMMMSMLYTGITMFRGMLNTIQFIIKVVLIICGIMIAIIIILIFVLFPFIPLIMATLGAIITAVLSLTMVISGDIANQASSDKGGFCFSEDVNIIVKDASGNEVLKSVKDIKIGDVLGNTCGTVTAIILMDGTHVPLYNLEGINVSGTHLVQTINGKWDSVANDSRAKLQSCTSKILYCFNTTTHTIPVYSPTIKSFILFRDWEELAENDEVGQFMWNYTILNKLNKNSNYDKWKRCLKPAQTYPLLGPKVKIKCTDGTFRDVSSLNIFDSILDSKGCTQQVLGVIEGEISASESELDDDEWKAELYELEGNIWIRGESTYLKGDTIKRGYTIITETGEFIIWDKSVKKEILVRDFTDIGYNSIYETYPFVASRLRIID